MEYLSRFSRALKSTTARGIHQRLAQRLAAGPPEPALDVFINEVDDIADRLETHVTGKTLADAARATRLAQRDAADDGVDTWFRHIESFTSIEGHRRTSPHAADALALNKAAFPDGLAHLDAYVPEQNVRCRASLEVLRAPEHAETIAAIGLPVAWIDSFEASLKASEAAHEDFTQARTDKSVHVDLGRDVEADWVDTMRRLLRLVESRARKGGPAKEAEGAQLLEPLLTALKKMQADHAARATRKKKKEGAAAPAGKEAAPPASPATPATPVTPTPPSGKDADLPAPTTP